MSSMRMEKRAAMLTDLIEYNRWKSSFTEMNVSKSPMSQEKVDKVDEE